MTRATLHPTDYVDPAVFAREQETIGHHCWHYVCLDRDIPNKGDYQRYRLGGREIFVYNTGDRIVAYGNVCSHRHSQIFEDPTGNGPIRCPYHAWMYNADGLPSGYPAATQFPEVRKDRQAFGLPRVAVERIGHFVFVAWEPRATLRAYLGPDASEFLTRVSGALGEPIDRFTGDLACNWKIAIENSLEGYHVGPVHTETLGSIPGMEREAVATRFLIPSDPEIFHTNVNTDAAKDWLAKWGKKTPQLGTWPYMFEHYVHYLLFPNLTITSFLGYSFHVQRFDAAGLAHTHVTSRTFGTVFAGQTPIGEKMIKAIYDSGNAFTLKVFGEDRWICERVQAGVGEARARAVFAAKEEQRVAHFQHAVATAMGRKAHVPAPASLVEA